MADNAEVVVLGPAFTILTTQDRGDGKVSIVVRQRGGRTVRICIPLGTHLSGFTDDAIETALAHLPPLPGPNT